jgi:hypothetical protein
VPIAAAWLDPTQDRPSAGPQIYGRQEDGGAVLGLKFPIPATRGIN